MTPLYPYIAPIKPNKKKLLYYGAYGLVRFVGWGGAEQSGLDGA